MKRTSALLTLSCICTLLVAQETASKFSISAFFSPTVAHRLASGDASLPQEIVEVYNDTERPKAGYSTGLLARYSFSEKISIQTGISFSNNGYLFKKDELRWGIQFNGSGFDPLIPLPDGTPTAIKIVYQHYYIDVPLLVKYTFVKKNKISVYAIAGAEANFNISNKQTVTYWYGDDKERETADYPLPGNYEFEKYNCSVVAGVGVDIALGSNVALFVQPTYRQMLLPMVDSPAKRRLYSVGLATGVTVSL